MDNSEPTPSSTSTDKVGRFRRGQVLSGKYKVLSILGTGGMGVVYRVHQVFLNQIYALKTLDVERGSDRIVRRLQFEAQTAASLRHPNLVQVHDFGLLENEEIPFLAMDFVDGITLAERLTKNGSMSVDVATKVFAQACLGLAYAHEQGVIHRDIKPGNLMLVNGAEPGEEGSIKIVDFGIAKVTTAGGEIQALTRTGEIFGSPLYMSPEQCSGDVVDHRSDIYSLGCVLFEALTGTPPHFGNTALNTMMMHVSTNPPSLQEASLGKNFSPQLERVVAKMLAKSPADRYQNLGRAAHDLAGISRSAPIVDAMKLESIVSEQTATVTVRRRTLYSIIVLIMFFTAIISGASGYLLSQYQISASTPVTSQTVNGIAAADNASRNGYPAEGVVFKNQWIEPDILRAAFKNSKPINAVIDSSTGEKKLTFPIYSIGHICTTRNFNYDDNDQDAKGEVSFPVNVRKTLVVDAHKSTAVIEPPSVLSKVAPDIFTGFFLRGPLKFSDGRLVKGRSEEGLPGDVANVMESVGKWTRLEVLALRGLPLNKRALGGIESLKTLKYLKMEECPMEFSQLAGMALLKQVESLTLMSMPQQGVDEVVASLAKSNKISEIKLEYNDASPAYIRLLSTCPHLSSLTLKQHSFAENEEQLIEAISKLPHLRDLNLTGAEISFPSIERLLPLTNLHVLLVQHKENRQADLEVEKRSHGRILINEKIKSE